MKKYERWAKLFKLNSVFSFGNSDAKIRCNHDNFVFESKIILSHRHAVNAHYNETTIESYVKECLCYDLYQAIIKHEQQKFIKTLPRNKQKLLKR